MAAGRVTLLVGRQLTQRSLLSSRIVLCAGVPIVSNKRPLCSKAMEVSLPDTKEYRRATYKMNRGFLGRFWDWLHTDLEQDTYDMGETEKKERELLLHRIQEMYFAKPPVAPDLTVYSDVFQTLVKYKDRTGVETLWRLMIEMGVEPDESLSALVEPFLEEARKNVWFE